MNAANVKNIEMSRFQKTIQRLIFVLFLPIMVLSVFSIYIYSSTKSNSNLPSGFGLHVVTVPEEIDIFSAGEIVVVKDVEIADIRINDYVAFFVASEQPAENGSEIAFKKVLEIINDNGTKRFRFENETYYQIENAVIGKHYEASKLIVDLLSFFSKGTVVISLALVPLLILLVLLVVYIIEQFSATRLKRNIERALAKAESAGFDTKIDNYKNLERFAKIDAKKPVPPVPQPAVNAQVKMPPRVPTGVETVQKPIVQPKPVGSAGGQPMPPKTAPKPPVPQKNVQTPPLPPKNVQTPPLPPKHVPSAPAAPKPQGQLPPKK